MRNEVIAAIEEYSLKNGIYYSTKDLLEKSNKELLSILIEELEEYFS